MPRPLGELEDAVMTRLWQWNRPATVREVLADLHEERELAYTTVMTVMDKLHQKGWLRRERDGRAYRYEAVSTREAYSAALMHDAWSTSDNRAAALVHFFGMMSPDEVAALRDALRVAGPHNERAEDEKAEDEKAEDEKAEDEKPGTESTGGEPDSTAEGGDSPA